MTPCHISYCVLDSLYRCYFIVKHLDVSTSANRICKLSDGQKKKKKDAFVWSRAQWCDWSKDNGRLIITVAGHPLPLTWSGGIYLIRLVCYVLTLCERHFNCVTHEEKLRGPCVDYWHQCMLNGVLHWSNCFCFAGLHVCCSDTAHDWCSMSRFNNGSVTFLTLSQCCIMVLASFYGHRF